MMMIADHALHRYLYSPAPVAVARRSKDNESGCVNTRNRRKARKLRVFPGTCPTTGYLDLEVSSTIAVSAAEDGADGGGTRTGPDHPTNERNHHSESRTDQ